jgi:hypothetical protein
MVLLLYLQLIMVEMNAMICINIIFKWRSQETNQYSDVAENGYSFSLNGNKIAMQIDIETPFRQQIFIYDIKQLLNKSRKEKF